MTTSRIYAYRWPARLVSHKPFAAERYSITSSCIWQVFFRKKNEFSFLFSPFCQSAHFLCKMHNPQAFLPVENSAAPAAQCLVWTVLPLLYIYNKRQGRSTTVLALSVKACRTTPKYNFFPRAAAGGLGWLQVSSQAGAGEAAFLPRCCFRRKQALQMPFAFTTPPVKKQIGKIRRFS